MITKVESDSDDDDEKQQTLTTSEKNKNVPFEDKTFPEVAFAVDKAILREVEEMEEKVFTASLQVKVKNCFTVLMYRNWGLSLSSRLHFFMANASLRVVAGLAAELFLEKHRTDFRLISHACPCCFVGLEVAYQSIEGTES